MSAIEISDIPYSNPKVGKPRHYKPTLALKLLVFKALKDRYSEAFEYKLQRDKLNSVVVEAPPKTYLYSVL